MDPSFQMENANCNQKQNAEEIYVPIVMQVTNSFLLFDKDIKALLYFVMFVLNPFEIVYYTFLKQETYATELLGN